MRIIGFGVIVVAVALGVAAALAATWFLLVGGIFDLADGRTLSAGFSRLEEWNREYADRWGRPRLGLLKVFVLEPILLVIIALATRAAVGVGRRIARSADLDRAPGSPAHPVHGRIPLHDSVVERPEPPRLAVQPADEPSGWDVPPLPTVIARAPASEDDQSPEPNAGQAATLASEPQDEHTSAPDTRATGAAAIDDTITLRTLADNSPVELTVRRIVDPVDPSAREGERYVAVLLEFRNPGPGLFEDMPTGGARLVGSDSTAYRTAAQKQQPALREVRLAPGENCEGYLSFKLPDRVAATAFRFTPNLGLAPDSGEWRL